VFEGGKDRLDIKTKKKSTRGLGKERNIIMRDCVGKTEGWEITDQE